MKEKIKATEEGNLGKRTLAKLMLNALYGKFAKNPKQNFKVPYIGADNIIHYKEYEDTAKGLYLPVASFITSQARILTISTAQKIKDYSIRKYGKNAFVYS